MPYIPTLEDLPEEKEYVPSLNDIEKENKSSPTKMSRAMAAITGLNTGVERFAHGALQPLLEGGLASERLKKSSRQVAKQREKEYADAAGSYPNYAGVGEIAGSLIGSSPLFAIPGLGAAGGFTRAATQGAIQGGLMGAGQYVPEDGSRALNTTIGAVGGAVLSPVVKGLTSANPLVKGATGATVGGLAGYGLHQNKGNAVEGAVIGGLAALAPQTVGAYGGRAANFILNKLDKPSYFIKRTPLEGVIVNNMLQGVDPKNALSKLDAARRLGLSYLTPAETGSPISAFAQGRLGSSKYGANTLTQKGKERLKEEAGSIEDLLNTISPKDAKKIIIEPAYAKAYPDLVPQQELSSLLLDPTIKAGFDDVASNPWYAKKLTNVPINSIQYLHQVKQYLDDVAGATAKKEGKKYLSGLQTEDTKTLLNVMDKSSPAYKAAREAANKNYIRGEIEGLLNKDDVSGTTFYEKALKNPKNYEKLYEKLKVVPDAQKKLADMRLVFKDLINPTSVHEANKSGKDVISKSGFSGSMGKLATDIANKLTNGFYDKGAVKLITSPNWDNELKEIIKIQNKDKRALKLSELLGKIGVNRTVNAISQPENILDF